MLGYNKVTLLGNLTKDPEIQSAGQTNVCNATIAVNERGADGNDTATFVDLAFWGKQAETIAQYGSKGCPIMVDGKLNVSKWERDGQTRVKYRVSVTDFRFVGPKNGTNTAGGNQPIHRHGGYQQEDVPF